MLSNRVWLATAVTVAALVQIRPATAQTDPMHLAYVSTANQTGVMEYCVGKGWADQAALDAQKQASARIPASSDGAGLQEAEATGRKGAILNNGTPMPLATMAQQSHTTEQELCARMASAAKTVAAQQSSMPAMPTMPGGMAMPALPPGMAVPSMPGMPRQP